MIDYDMSTEVMKLDTGTRENWFSWEIVFRFIAQTIYI